MVLSFNVKLKDTRAALLRFHLNRRYKIDENIPNTELGSMKKQNV